MVWSRGRRPVRVPAALVDAVSWIIKLYRDRRWTDQVGEVLAGTFDGIIQLGEHGEFRIEAPVNGTTVSDRDDHRVKSVLVLDGGSVLFAGLTLGVGKHGEAGETTIGWWGREVYGVLLERSGYPEVFEDGDWSTRSWRYTGQVSTVAAAAVDAQFGLAAGADRYARVKVIDVGAGPVRNRSVKPTERLDDLIARLQDGSGLTCSTTIIDTGDIVFRFGAAVVRPIRFSNAELASWDTKVTHSTLTHVTGIGPARDDGTRQVLVRTTGAQGADRIEKVLEVSGDEAEQIEEVEAALAAGREQWYVAATLIPSAAARFKYPRDYQVGDIVTVEIEGVPFTVPITAVRLSRDDNGVETVIPVLGGAPPNRTSQLYRRLRGLERYQRRHAV